MGGPGGVGGSWGHEVTGPTLPVPSSRGLRSTPSKVTLGSGAPARAARVGSRSRELASSWVTPAGRGLYSHAICDQGWGDGAKSPGGEGLKTDREQCGLARRPRQALGRPPRKWFPFRIAGGQSSRRGTSAWSQVWNAREVICDEEPRASGLPQ